MTDACDVVVVGAGPAGATTARGLARRGASVLLVDRARFPRFKVCGCCLNPRALNVLERTGLGSLTTRLGGVPLRRLELATAGRRARLRYDLGIALSREALDAALAAEAVAAGVEWIAGASASLGDRPGLVRIRSDAGDCDLRARFVVSATGLGDGLFPSQARAAPAPGSRLGAGVILHAAPPGFEPGTIFMACGGGAGYVGLVVLEDGRFDMAAALDPLAVREAGGVGPLASSILAASPLPPVPGAAEAPWRGTPPLTRSPARVVEAGVLRVGDSAGYVEPFTGEGMAWALAGGEALAGILADALRTGDARNVGRRWEQVHRAQIRQRQFVCRVVGRTLRSPRLSRWLVAALDFQPALARPLLKIMHRR